MPSNLKEHIASLIHEWTSVGYWSNDDIGKTEKNGRKLCPSVTLSTTNLTRTARGLNPELRGKRKATNRLGAGSLDLHPIRKPPPTDGSTARAMWWAILTYLLHGAACWEANRFLVNKFPSFYGIRRFITAFTSARHLSLSWARSIQSMPSPLSEDSS